VRKLIGLGVLLLATACSRKVEVSSPAPTPSAPGTVGGATPAEAIAKLMAAAKAEDLQAFGAAWGDTKGSAREQMSRNEFEMRAFYMVKCLRNDKFAAMNESGAAGGRRIAAVQISKGPLTKQTNFTMIKGPQERWFVENVELEPLTQICQMA
jgi:hypothetical protein